MPLSLADIQREKATYGLEDIPVEDYAALMEDLFQNGEYAAGLKPNLFNRFNALIEGAAEDNAASDAIAEGYGQIGALIDSSIGNPNRDYERTGEMVGRKALRGLGEVGAWFVAPQAAIPRALTYGARAAGMASSAAGAYSESGNNPLAGVLGAITPPAIKYSGDLGAAALGPRIGRLLGAGVEEAAPATVSSAGGLLTSQVPQQALVRPEMQALADYLGSQAGMFGGMTALGEAGSLARGEGLYNPVAGPELFAQGLTQLPFAALDTARVFAGAGKARTAMDEVNAARIEEQRLSMDQWEMSLADQLMKWQRLDERPGAPDAPEGATLNEPAVKSRFDVREDEIINRSLDIFQRMYPIERAAKAAPGVRYDPGSARTTVPEQTLIKPGSRNKPATILPERPYEYTKAEESAARKLQKQASVTYPIWQPKPIDFRALAESAKVTEPVPAPGAVVQEFGSPEPVGTTIRGVEAAPKIVGEGAPQGPRGLFMAVKLQDGSIVADRGARYHADVLQRNGIAPEQVADTGFVDQVGKYESAAAEPGAPLQAIPGAEVTPAPVTSVDVVNKAFPDASRDMKQLLVRTRDKALGSIKADVAKIIPGAEVSVDEFFQSDPGTGYLGAIQALAEKKIVKPADIERAMNRILIKKVLDYHQTKDLAPELAKEAAEHRAEFYKELRSELKESDLDPLDVETTKASVNYVNQKIAGAVVMGFLRSAEGQAWLVEQARGLGRKRSADALLREFAAAYEQVFAGNVAAVKSGSGVVFYLRDRAVEADFVQKATGRQTKDNQKATHRILDTFFQTLGDGQAMKDFIKAKYGIDIPKIEPTAAFESPAVYQEWKDAWAAGLMPGGVRLSGGKDAQHVRMPSRFPNAIRSGFTVDETLHVMEFAPLMLEKAVADAALQLGLDDSTASFLARTAENMKKHFPYLSDIIGAGRLLSGGKGAKILQDEGTMAIFQSAFKQQRPFIKFFTAKMADASKHPSGRAKILLRVFGHEMGHGGDDAILGTGISPRAGEAYGRATSYLESLSPREQMDVLEASMNLMFSGSGYVKGADFDAYSHSFQEYVRQVHASGGNVSAEIMAELSGMIHNALTLDAQRAIDALGYVPKPLHDLVSAYAEGMKAITAIATHWARGMEMAGLAKQKISPHLAKIFGELLYAATRERQVADALSRLDHYREFLDLTKKPFLPDNRAQAPPGWKSGLDSAFGESGPSYIKTADALMKSIGMRPDPEGKYGPTPNMLVARLLNPHILGDMYPKLKPFLDVAAGHSTDVKQAQTAMLAMLQGGTKRWKDTDLYAVEAKDKTLNIFNKIAAEQQRVGEEGGALFTPQEAHAKAKSFGATDKEAQLLSRFFGQTIKVHQAQGAMLLEGVKDDMAHKLALILQAHNPAISADTALEAAYPARDIMMQGGDPTQVLAPAGPAASQAALAAFGTMQKYYKGVEEIIVNRPWHLSERQPGSWAVEYRDKAGNEKTNYAMNLKERNKLHEKLAKAGNTITDTYEVGAESKYGRFNKDMGQVLLTMDQQLEGLIKDLPTLGDEEKAELLSKLPGRAIIEGSIKGPEQFLLRREGKVGRENLNYIDNMLNSMRSISYSLSRQFVYNRASVMLKDPSMAGSESQRFRQLAKEIVEHAVNPGYKEHSLLKSFVANHSIALNLGNMIAEGFQPLATMVPYLARYFPKTTLRGAYGEIASAAKASWEYGLSKKFSDPLLQKIFDRATKEGHLELGGKLEFTNMDDDLAMVDLHNLSEGRREGSTPYKLLKTGFYHYLQLTRKPTLWLSQLNNRIAFISGFRAATREGQSYEDAYNTALRTIRSTQYTGGRTGRPLAFGMVGKAGGPLGLIYSLQHYATSVYSQMYAYGRDAIGASGLRGQELHRAQRALAAMVATQVSFAGLLGVPFAGAALGLMRQAGMDVENDVQDFLGGDGDSPENRFIGQMLFRGAYAPLANVDLGPKFSLSSVPLTPLGRYGFDWKNMFSAPGGVLQQLATSGKAAIGGEVGVAGEQAAPQWLKGVVRLWRGDGNLPQQDTNATQTVLTDGEQALTALGLKSARVANLEETKRRQTRSADSYKQETERSIQKISKALQAGDMRTGTGIMREMVARDERLSLADVARMAIKQMEDDKFGMDPQRFTGRVAPEDQQRMLWMLDQPQFTEADRVRFRQGVQQQLFQALPELRVAMRQVTARNIAEGQIIDTLMRTYGVNRSSALALARAARKGKPLSLQPELPVPVP